jgi:hypothetical protein
MADQQRLPPQATYTDFLHHSISKAASPSSGR